jgi:hypothetical protein
MILTSTTVSSPRVNYTLIPSLVREADRLLFKDDIKHFLPSDQTFSLLLVIEHLPNDLRDRFTEMREIDLGVENTVDSLEARLAHCVFSNVNRWNAKKIKQFVKNLNTVRYLSWLASSQQLILSI